MKIGKVGWVIIVIGILSGWIAFGIRYAYVKTHQMEFDSKILDVRSRLMFLNFLSKEIDKSAESMEKIHKTLEELKEKIAKLKEAEETKK